MIYGHPTSGGPTLQAILASATHATPFTKPHHPITCTGALYYEPDGTFRCEHVAVPPNNPRTRHCLNTTAAVLLLQLASEL